MKINRLFTMATTILLLLSLGTGIVLAQEEPPPEPKNPVALFLAGLLGTDYSYKGIVDDQIAGIGLGVIGRAYSLSQITGVGVADILKDSQMYDWGQLQKAYIIANNNPGWDLEEAFMQASEKGWGQLFKEAGLHPGSGGHGLGWLFKEYGAKGRPDHTGPPDWAGLKTGSHAPDHTGPPGHAGKNNKNKDKRSDE